MRKFAITYFIFLYVLQPVFCQNDFRSGFIITLKKDTIHGVVAFRSDSKNFASCIFKVEPSKTSEYFPGEISGFGFEDDKFFVSGIKPNYFVEVLVEGAVNLYRFEDAFLITKNGGEVNTLEARREMKEINGRKGMQENNKWRGVLSFLLSDCISKSNQIQNLNFGERNITNVVVEYNKCQGAEFTTFKSDIPWVRLSPGVSTGLVRSKVFIHDPNDFFPSLDKNYASFSPSVGLMVRVVSPRTNERVSFISGLEYYRMNQRSQIIENGTSWKEYHESYIHSTILSIPAIARYTIPKRLFSTFFSVGLNINNNIKPKTKTISERQAGNIVSTEKDEPFDIRKWRTGFSGDIGISRSFFDFNFELSLRYGRVPKYNKAVSNVPNNGYELARSESYTISLAVYKR